MTQELLLLSPPAKVPSSDQRSRSKLYAMISSKRPHFSKAECRFVTNWVMPLGCIQDGFGNCILKIGESPILWSSHTDTVHNKGGEQHLMFTDASENVFGLDPQSKSNCLGADDTAGVWLMHEMIEARIPGTYIFHRGEERGCLGSNWLLKNNKKALEGIKYAIALDRRGKQDVITRQRGMSCSDEFATSLAEQLGLGYRPDPTGIYTDTATYTGVIPECTNLSVGYEHAHSANETLDVKHLFELREKLMHIDASKLVEKRKPGENSYKYSSYSQSDYDWSHGYYDKYSYNTNHKGSVWYNKRNRKAEEILEDELTDVVRANPRGVAKILQMYSYTALDLQKDILDVHGRVNTDLTHYGF